MANINKTVKLGVFTLAIMNVTAVVSLRGLPSRIRTKFGFLLLIRGNRILNPDLFGGSGISGNVPRQTRWCIPLGR